MECHKCQLQINQVSDLFRHYRFHHGFSSSGSEVRCPVANCPRAFMSFCKLKQHILSRHDELTQNSCAATTNSLVGDCFDTEMGDNETFNCSSENVVEEQVIINLQHSLMTFLTRLGSKANITSTNIQTVVDNLSGLIQDIENFSLNVINELCQDLGFEKSHSSVQSALAKINTFSNMFSSLGSVHKRNKWLSDKGYLILPEEIELGTREEQRSSVGKHSYSSVTVHDTYQYLHLEKLIPKLLEHDSFVVMMNEHKKACMESEVVTDFMCTDSYSKHELFRRHPNAIILNCFIDAFETVNPLGSHTSVHKLEGLYCTIGNLSPQNNSKTSSIFLIGLWYAQDVKTYGYDRILEPFVKELKQLESDRGVQVLVHA